MDFGCFLSYFTSIYKSLTATWTVKQLSVSFSNYYDNFLNAYMTVARFEIWRLMFRNDTTFLLH